MMNDICFLAPYLQTTDREAGRTLRETNSTIVPR